MARSLGRSSGELFRYPSPFVLVADAGIQTIELEHSSLHLICPALPRNPPNPPFSPVDPTPQKDAAGSIGELLAIMQRRMPQFVGRGLPTVWDTVCDPERQQLLPISTGRDDMSAIRAWAGEIDAWYSHVATESTCCGCEMKLTLFQRLAPASTSVPLSC